MSSKLRIVRLILVPTERVYQDVYQRPFSINPTARDIDTMEQTFARNGIAAGKLLTSTSIASTLSGVVGFDTVPTGIAEVVNGWGTQRLRFMLEVSLPGPGSETVYYIQGYSEYHDPSMSGIIDPHMAFHINSISTVSRTNNPMGGPPSSRLTSSYNVITDAAGGARYQTIDHPDNQNNLALIRPCDVLNDLSNDDLYGDHRMVNNTVGHVAGAVNSSRRGNGDVVNYFGTTLNAVIKGKSMSDIGHNPVDYLNTASATVEENSLFHCELMYAISTLTGAVSPTSFTLGNLEAIDGNTSNVTILIKPGELTQTSGVSSLDTYDPESMMNPTMATMVATEISHSITSALADNMLTKLDCTFGNRSGQYIVAITAVNTFVEGIDTTRYATKVEHYLSSVTLPKITRNNQLMVEAYVSADILGDITIGVGIENDPMIVFRLPAFADSLYQPVVTTKSNRGLTTEAFANIIDLTNPGYQY